jgi:enoyl-CoA hydratase/carnithine racemase
MDGIPAGVGREILFEIIDEHVALVTLNRPEKRNAVNGVLAAALDHVVKAVERDDNIRAAILISSLPNVFCAGADIAEIAAGRASTLSTPDGGFAGLQTARRDKPWIAAVRGSALGGGLELCLACDMIVAANDAQFGLPEVKRGLFPAAGGASRLPRVIPRNIALELLATGGSLPASRAMALGLVNRLADADQVLETARQLAREISANAPLAVRESLKIARIAAENSELDLRQMSRAAADRVFVSQDAKEGTAAFLEKRKPNWSGR